MIKISIQQALWIVVSALSLALCSCQKEEYDDLGEFERLRSSIDMSQTNRFDESLFSNDWMAKEWGAEIYVDGVFNDSDIVENTGMLTVSLSLREDHTVTFRNKEGKWRYYHNHLLIHLYGEYYAYEVMGLSSGTLKLRQEQYELGAPAIDPFFVDKSGKHHFYVIEYCAAQ